MLYCSFLRFDHRDVRYSALTLLRCGSQQPQGPDDVASDSVFSSFASFRLEFIRCIMSVFLSSAKPYLFKFAASHSVKPMYVATDDADTMMMIGKSRLVGAAPMSTVYDGDY